MDRSECAVPRRGTAGGRDQKQALNALVFFYRDVCGHETVDLEVRMKKTERRQPMILNRVELMGLIGKLEERYQTPALLQYGSGLRLKELVQLRIKDIDLERGVLTVHAGKGDKDRLTVIPNRLKEVLTQVIAGSRAFWDEDRANQVAGVALPGALGRKMPKAGEKMAVDVVVSGGPLVNRSGERHPPTPSPAPESLR